MATIYPDSAEGARRALREECDWNVEVPDEAKATIDPEVEGVWLIETDEFRAVVYLAGYRDPFGRVREENDFEIYDPIESKEDLIDSGYGGGYDHPFDL